MATQVKNKVAETDGNGNRQEPSLVLAYLSCPQDAAKSFLGALLITDERTRPLHFGFVSPVRPTAMQRLLYGPTLSEHVRIEVIAKKLSEGLSFRPAVLFVDSEELLEAKRVLGTPTAHLYAVPETERGGSNLSLVRYNTGGCIEDEETVGKIVSVLEHTNLLDPFVRVQEALKEVLRGAKDQ